MTLKLIEIGSTISMVFFVLSVHELGHLIMGLIQGFRFELFVVGPLGIKREQGEIKLYFNKNLAHYGGIAATLPTDNNPNNIKKLANVCLAGPIASICLAIVLLIMSRFIDFQFTRVLSIGGMASLGVFLATTIPSKTGMFFTDRKRYQRLTKNGPDRDVEIALLRILGNYAKDDSYINIDEQDIETLINDKAYNFFGLFTKLTYQLEKQGYFDPETHNQYKELSKTMPNSTVKVMDKELNNSIEKYAHSSNN